jgi:nucleotide-binding universal stress UspA family protein
MNQKTILFATDLSTSSDAALEYATSLAASLGAKLLIVHVEENPLAYGAGEMYYGTIEPDTDALRKMLYAVKPHDPAIHYEHRLLLGEPAGAIVDLAEREGIDMIVLATNGRTGLMHFVMGSVAEEIVRTAPCPVVTVKMPHKQPVAAT